MLRIPAIPTSATPCPGSRAHPSTQMESLNLENEPLARHFPGKEFPCGTHSYKVGPKAPCDKI